MSDLPVCSAPLDATLLSDYWLATLSSKEEAGVEEHLFTCDSCGARLDSIVALMDALRALTHTGSLSMVVPQAFLDRAAAQNLHIREYAPPAGSSVQCTVVATDDLLIGRLAGDFKGHQRLDLSVGDPNGAEYYRLADIPFNPEASAVLWQQSITFAKAAPSGSMTARLFSVDNKGQQSLLGEYVFNHTRTMPGPADW